MAYQLTIGSTMFDAAEGLTNASTIAGTRIMFGENADDSLTVDDSGGAVRVPFKIEVVADDVATFATRVQEVRDALDEVNAEGFVVALDGVDHVDVDPALYERLQVDRKEHLGPDDEAPRALFECTLVADALDADPNAITSTWTYQRNHSGRALAIGRITASTRAAAVAAVSPLRLGSARPAWMSSAFRVIEDTAEFDAAAGAPQSLSDSQFRPATVTVVFEQMPAWMSGDARFANVRRAECVFEATNRAALPARANQDPGINVTVRGTIELWTERNTSWDSTEPTPTASAAMRSIALACAAAMLSEAERRLDSGPVTLIVPMEDSVTGQDGSYTFTLTGVTGGSSRILSWEESELYEVQDRDEIVDLAANGQWVFGRQPLVTIQHTLSIESLTSPRPYVPPVSLGTKPGRGSWKTRIEAHAPPEVQDAGNGVPRRVNTTYRRVYQFIFSGGAGGGGGGQTVARP